MNYRIASLFYCLFVLWSKGIAAQTPDSIETKLLGWMARGDTSVFAITQEANNYLDTTQSASKEAFAKKYGRWYNVWNNRIDSFGQIDKAANKMLNYLSEISEFDQICENGGDWKLLGPLKNTESGKQNLGIVVTFHTQNANSDTVIIGSNSGGIWRTINANDTFPDWECISDLSRKPAMGVSSIVVDPNNPLILYAATGNHSNPPSVFYGMGVLKSTDGGLNWNNTGLTWDPNSNQPYEMITLLKVHPNNSNIIYAASSNIAARIYKSSDAGNTWSTILTHWGIDKIYDIEFAIGRPDTIFISDGDNRDWDKAGIYRSFDGVNNLEIARSEFEVGGFPKKRTGTSNIHEGVSMNEALGFIVTENQFSNSVSNPTNAARLGTRSSSLGRVYNVFYNNKLASIQFGHLANGTNAMSGSPFLGLNYSCNTHSSNWSDITAYGGSINDREVIALRQGSPNVPTSNEFGNTLVFNVNNFDSLYQSPVTYFYYQDSTNEEPVFRRNVFAFSTSNQIGCQSQLSDSSNTAGNPVSDQISIAEYDELVSNFTNVSDEFDSKNTAINSLIDNGDTPYWLDQVVYADNSNASSIANDLRGFSPWISESVLLAMIDNSEFDVADIMLVLEDNPDILRSVSFMNYLRESDRFDASEIEALYTAMENTTDRTGAESELSYLFGLKFNYTYRIIRNHLNDTSGIKLDSIHTWLQLIPSLETAYTRVELLRQTKDWAESGKVLDSIPVLYNLTDSQTVAFNDYKTLHELLYRIDTAGIPLQSMDSSDYAVLLALSGKNYNRAVTQAQSILNYAFGHNFRRPALLPEEIEARPIMQEAKDPETAKGEVWAQPNPASQFAIIGYILPEGKKEAMLKVVDAYGRLLLVIPVNADKNNEMFNVAHWAAGTYYVYLEGNGWKSKANSFVVCN